jgi:hypothetical protein
VLVLVLVLERCCLQKRRVNPIRSAFPELHPRSGLKLLVRRFVRIASRCREVGIAFPDIAAFWSESRPWSSQAAKSGMSDRALQILRDVRRTLSK